MQHHRDLDLFLHLVETLNFGRTSSECHVSTATLTRAVQRLEVQSGHRLFDRGPRGVTPTAAGQRFADYARAALALWREQLADAPAEPETELVGELRLFATVTACRTLLPAALAPLRRAHPGVRLDLRTGDAGAALARLEEGDVDAAVAPLPARLPATLVARTLAVTDLVLVVARGHEGTAHAAPVVVPRRGLVRAAAERWFRTREVEPVVVAEPESHEALLTLVELGYGAGIVPRLVLDGAAGADGLVAVDHVAPYPIGLCVRRVDLHRDLVARLWASVPA